MSRKHITRDQLAQALMSESLASVVRTDGSWEWWAEGPDALAAAIFEAVPPRLHPTGKLFELRGRYLREHSQLDRDAARAGGTDG